MSDFRAFLKRGAPAAWPHEITVVEDEAHPLYDPRIEKPVTDERIRNLVLVGQIHPVSIRVDGDDGLLVAGRTRWKCATVINHLSGAHPYRGSLACIREAISRNKGSDLEKLAADRCAKGIKLQFVLHRGEMADATAAMVSENEQRDDDPLEAKIRRAQRLVGQGHSNEDMAVMFGVTAQTIGRWLARDLSKPREKKARATVKRPSAKVIDHVEKMLFAIPESVVSHAEARGACLALQWALGMKSHAEMVKFFPWLAEALGKTSAKEAA